MKLNRFCALLLCTATLLSGCGTASNRSLGSDVSAQSESDASQPLSELDRPGTAGPHLGGSRLLRR